MIEITRSADGRLRVTPGTVPPLLADFLETDIGLYHPRAEEILAVLADSDRKTRVSFYGNLYALHIGVTEAIIEGLFEESPALTLPLKQLETGVRRWHRALRGGDGPLD